MADKQDDTARIRAVFARLEAALFARIVSDVGEQRHTLPEVIQVDNGTEFTSTAPGVSRQVVNETQTRR